MNAKIVNKVLPSEEEEEEELVDPAIEIRASCAASRCQQEVVDYEGCVKRIEGDETGEKNCAAWLFDMRTCIDHCVCSNFRMVSLLLGLFVLMKNNYCIP